MLGTRTVWLWLSTGALALAMSAAAVAQAQPPIQPAPIAPNATIHAGDLLSVTVYGEPTLTQNVTVLADSSIDYPLVGRVSLANQTPAEAGRTLTTAFEKYLRHPLVSVGIVNEGELTVMVLGNVKTPGKYQIPYESDVTDAIAAAGGLGPVNGPYPVARVTEANGVHEAPLQAILHDGDVTEDVNLHNNAIVYIPSPLTFDVTVIGAVDHPGTVTLNQGDHLTDAIAKAGNSAAAQADLNGIKVTRDENGTTKTFSVNLYNELEKGDSSANLVMEKNDVVYVPKAKQTGAQNSGSVAGILGRIFGLW